MNQNKKCLVKLTKRQVRQQHTALQEDLSGWGKVAI